MQNLSRMLAWRYVTFSNKESTIAFMIRICFLGIFIGSFTLMMTLIIMHGFEETIHEKMQGINADITILPPRGNKLALDQIRHALMQQFPKQIDAISGSTLQQIIVDKDDQQSVLFLKGIEPEQEQYTTSLAKHITNNQADILQAGNQPLNKACTNLQEVLVDNGIVLGYKLAQSLNLHIGDELTLFIPQPGQTKKIYLKKKTARLAGIAKVGLDELDQGFAFTHIDFARTLFDQKKEAGVDTISIRTNLASQQQWWERYIGNNQEKQLLRKLRERLPLMEVSTWQELYPALVSSLKLEKYVMFCILALITLVASLNMISLLVLQIQQKKRDIAIYQAMGMPQGNITTIFLRIGMSITTSASLLGLGLAAFCGWLLERYPIITLPDVYYVSHLPARMNWDIFVIVFLATLILGFIATYLPSRKTKTINITSVLRAE